MSSKNVLAALGESDQYITLGLELAGEIVPLGKALVREIKTIATGTETTTYQLLLEADSKELDAIAALSLADLAAINGELAKLGKPPIVPISSGDSTPPTPITQAAPATAADVGATGDHGKVGDLGTNTPAVKTS